MAVPTRAELAAGRKGSIYNNKDFVVSDKSKYLAMKWDYDRGILSEYKKKEYQYNYRKNESETEKHLDIDGEEFEVEINKGKRVGYEYLIICKNG
jgi:hypothetical protein